MPNTNPNPINGVITSGSKIPTFTGKLTNLKLWLAALKKKECIYKLIDPELINLATDFLDGIALEWIGDYLNDHPNISGCPRGVIVKAMDGGIIVSEFKLQLRYYVHFRTNTLGKGMDPLILPAMG